MDSIWKTGGCYIFLLFSLVWTPIQVIFSLVLGCLFSVCALIVLIINPSLRTKFIVASVLWKGFCRLIINLSLLTKPLIIDRRSSLYRSNLTCALYICNHQSIWDIPLTLYYYQIVPIMKKELLNVPFLGLIARASTAIPVDRNDKDSRKKVVFEVLKRLKMGLPIQFYPEGTRNIISLAPKNYEDIKSTLLEIAFKNNITVVPSVVWGTRKVNTRFGLINFPVRLGLIVQKEIDPKDFSDEDSFGRACWAKVTEGYQELDQLLSKPY